MEGRRDDNGKAGPAFLADKFIGEDQGTVAALSRSA